MGKHAFWAASFQCMAKKLYTGPLYAGGTVPGNLKSYSIDRPGFGPVQLHECKFASCSTCNFN